MTAGFWVVERAPVGAMTLELIFAAKVQDGGGGESARAMSHSQSPGGSLEQHLPCADKNGCSARKAGNVDVGGANLVVVTVGAKTYSVPEVAVAVSAKDAMVPQLTRIAPHPAVESRRRFGDSQETSAAEYCGSQNAFCFASFGGFCMDTDSCAPLRRR